MNGGDVPAAAAPLEWKFSQVFGERTAGEEVQEGCLLSATSSILINGSPTREFNINRGLHQGDPLSPFLFIIAMEGLHVAMEDAKAAEIRTLRAKFFWCKADNSHKNPWIAGILTSPSSKGKGTLGIGSRLLVEPCSQIKNWRLRFLNYPQITWSRLISCYTALTEESSVTVKQEHLGYPALSVPLTAIIEEGLIPPSFHQRRVNNASYSQNILSDISLNDSEDVWDWTIDNTSFSVKSARHCIDRGFLPDDAHETRWNKLLPKKINIFIWRTLRDRLPSRWNLSRKGIDLNSMNCPICDKGIDTAFHTFWVCSLATSVWLRALT
ncbi:reverse transcriptase domain, reverse transcriptase zinc-binding domain protein [Tanacetum coccineum]